MSKDTQQLSQSDFRKLLQTPRAPPAGDGPQNIAPAGVLGKRRMLHKPQAPTKPTFVPRKKKPSAVQIGSEKYRDRAAERRQGLGGQDMPVPLATNVPVLGDASGSTEQQRIYEQSKHLGGDIEHTHLVKGLDYLLLEKMRAQTEAAHDTDLDMEIERLQAGRDSGEAKGQAITKLDAQTSTGIRVMEAVHKMAAPPTVTDVPNDMFQPGRMYFEFSLMPPLTTTVRIRSQDEVAQMFGATGNAGLDQRDAGDGLVISKVISAIAARRSACHSKQEQDQEQPLVEKRPELTPAPAPIAANDDDDNYEEDIFADAGVDYEVTVDNPDVANEPALAGPLPPPSLPSDSGSDDDVVAEPYPESP
ncbi:hypothetical protein LPJ70_000808 [Coemansia sp. RSA 2708]|nr:hypothetical protein LPJ70_000808 [Coemansia sp. RSA 2708]